MSVSILDTDLLSKVRALMDGGATEGERRAAKSRAEALAKKAGMTLPEALSKLDDAEATRSMADAFNDFFNSPDMRRHRAEAEAKRSANRERLLKIFGSEEAIFAETERERRLRVTLEPLANYCKYDGAVGLDGKWTETKETYINGYAGWICGRPPAALRHALNEAYPLPVTVTAAWAEYQEWENLMDARYAFEPDGDIPIWVRARQAALSSILDTYSEPTRDGLRSRFEWMHFHIKQEIHRDNRKESDTITALRLDFEMFMADIENARAADGANAAPTGATSTPVHFERRTNANKRADVLSMLDASPHLSDRAIARRVGVSPQTVNTWRRKIRTVKPNAQQGDSA
ncbi:winged helix-turn-helix domain-containing protein [Xanthobacter sp. VNH20]|uniref:winged helix-turn-helix domain-containing protein n=1 Tax=Xanthobacter sp. VNH20 TaxID=3156616 RepID=UPI0032B55165